MHAGTRLYSNLQIVARRKGAPLVTLFCGSGGSGGVAAVVAVAVAVVVYIVGWWMVDGGGGGGGVRVCFLCVQLG